MIHIHRLHGCAPAPLAHYLKALGILRLVSEQVDANARGWWDGDHFQLATTLTREELERFFLYRYQPTPLVSPWNKGSGFFIAKGSALSQIEKSKAVRFKNFRNAIKASRSALDDLSRADKKVRDIKAETKTGEHDVERDRRRYLEDYERLHSDLSKAQKDRDQIRDSENKRDLEKAEQRLKKAKEQIKAAEDYKEFLHTRDIAEKTIKDLKTKGAEKDQLKEENQRLKELFSRMKGSENYKRRLRESNNQFNSPALLGTGGNDGNLDFTNNFMQWLVEVFDLASDQGKPRHTATSWVQGSLWGVLISDYPTGRPVGQYLPGTAGGANNGNGPEGNSMVNPLDFVLMLEGATVFISHATRRFGSLDSSRAASPFVVNACSAGYASASAHDESARGEQWMPLWSHPSTFTELRHLLAEGRAQVGAKAVREPLDLARAVVRLGTARGISAFQRYGYIERNGKSNLAVPLGRFDVADQQSEHLACIDDLDTWLRHIRREARDQNAPARLVAVERRLVEALFTATQHPYQHESWQRVILQLGEVEEIMAHGSGYGAQPVPRLRPEWVAATYDGTPEARLAVAFALQARGFRREKGTPIDPIRRHWLSLDRKQPWRFATTGTGAGTRLDVQPEVVMHGRRGVDDAVALIERRLVEASQRGDRHLPLKAGPRAAACTADLVALLSGGVDLDRTLAMARALMALDRKAWAEQCLPMELPQTSNWPDDAWMAIRLCMLPWPLKTRSGNKLDIGADPVIVRRLAAGNAASAIALALRRLHAAGVRCTVRGGTTSPETARLWVAGLAFPITQRTAGRFLDRLDPNKE